jgi:hypothetical protein
MQNLCLVPTLRPRRESVALLARPSAAEETYESELAYLGASMSVCSCRACAMGRHPSSGR